MEGIRKESCNILGQDSLSDFLLDVFIIVDHDDIVIRYGGLSRQKFQAVFFYMKVSITYLITFIVRCGPSLVMDRPDRPMTVIKSVQEFGCNLHRAFQSRWITRLSL